MDRSPDKALLSKSSAKVLLVCLGCALGGYLVVWAPWRFAVANGMLNASNLIDGFQLVSLPLLVLVGFLAGRIVPSIFWLCGLCTMAAFPVVALVEMIIGSTSHNLWPIEFVIYVILTVPGILGATAARFAGGKGH